MQALLHLILFFIRLLLLIGSQKLTSRLFFSFGGFNVIKVSNEAHAALAIEQTSSQILPSEFDQLPSAREGSSPPTFLCNSPASENFDLQHICAKRLESGAQPTAARRVCSIKPNSFFDPNATLKYIHIIPHSHLDVGWLKTVDEYFSGLNNSIQFASVDTIVSSVVRALQPEVQETWGSCSDATFSFVEVAYLWRWWRQQNQNVRNIFLNRVKQGSVAIVSGGWTMHDEATTYYVDIMDEFALGHHFLYSLGLPIPTTGWQIDPFGHSVFTAWLFQNLNFDGVIVGRIDYQELQQKVEQQNLEFFWTVPEDLPRSPPTSIFYSVLRRSYNSPTGFSLDILLSQDDPIQSDDRLDGYNVADRLTAFYKQLDTVYSQGLRTRHIPIPMGSDFHFHSAEWNYKFLDQMISAANERVQTTKYAFLYSSPTVYVNAALSDVKFSLRNAPTTREKEGRGGSVDGSGDRLPVETRLYNVSVKSLDDDFFPYADAPGSYWTGFYTTRSNLKYLIRITSSFKNAFEKLVTLYWMRFSSTYIFPKSFVNTTSDTFATFAPIKPSLNSTALYSTLFAAQETMAVLQHHDAVTGSSKLHVIKDYARRLSFAVSQMLSFTGLIVQTLINSKFPGLLSEVFEVKLLPWNVSYLPFEVTHRTTRGRVLKRLNVSSTLETQFTIAIFNPLSWIPPPKALYYPLVGIKEGIFQVTLERLSLDNKLRPSWEEEPGNAIISENPLCFPDSVTCASFYAQLIFSNLSALEITVFRVTFKPETTLRPDSWVWIQLWERVKEPTVVSTSRYKLYFNSSGINTLELSELEQNAKISLSHRFKWFESDNGTQPSGYYILAPAKNNTANDSKLLPPAKVHTVPLVSVYHSYVVRLSQTDAKHAYQARNTKFFSVLLDDVLRRQKDHAVTPRASCDSVLLLYSNISKTSEEPLTRFPKKFPVYIKFTLCPQTADIGVEWSLGPLHLEDKVGKEILSVISSDIEHNATFQTDSNGYFYISRVRNQRTAYLFNQTDGKELEASNVYPVTTSLSLQGYGDTTKQKRKLVLALSVDRSTGGTSLVEGELSLLLHRLTLSDDYRGVGEIFNDTEPNEFNDILGQRVCGEYKLYLGYSENRTMTAQSVRDVNIYHRPVIVIGRGGAPPDAPMDTAVLRTLQFLPLLCFPSRIQLVSLYPVPAIPSTNRFSCFLSKLNGTEPILELIMRLRNMDTATSKQDAPFPRINVCTIFQHVSLIVRQTLRTTHTGVPNDKNSKHFFAFENPCVDFYLAPGEMITLLIAVELHTNITI